jgi:hypothetical protein
MHVKYYNFLVGYFFNSLIFIKFILFEDGNFFDNIGFRNAANEIAILIEGCFGKVMRSMDEYEIIKRLSCFNVDIYLLEGKIRKSLRIHIVLK